jgi:hypothetical protein
MKKPIKLYVSFSARSNAKIYEVDAVEVKRNANTARTTLRGDITIIDSKGRRRKWPQKRYDSRRLPLWV